MAEGGGLLNRYTLQRRIQGSNPCVSARFSGSESSRLPGNPLGAHSGPTVAGNILRSRGSLLHLRMCGDQIQAEPLNFV